MATTTTTSGPWLSAGAAGQRTRIAGSRLGIEKLALGRQHCARRNVVTMASDQSRGGGSGDFVAGFLLGGAVFGAVGFLLAPQVKRSFAEIVEKENGAFPKRTSRFLEDVDDEGEAIEQKTRKSLSDKISQLNAAIDTVSSQLRESENSEMRGAV